MFSSFHGRFALQTITIDFIYTRCSPVQVQWGGLGTKTVQLKMGVRAIHCPHRNHRQPGKQGCKQFTYKIKSVIILDQQVNEQVGAIQDLQATKKHDQDYILGKFIWWSIVRQRKMEFKKCNQHSNGQVQVRDNLQVCRCTRVQCPGQEKKSFCSFSCWANYIWSFLFSFGYGTLKEIRYEKCAKSMGSKLTCFQGPDK